MGCDTFFNMGSLRDSDVKGSGLEPRGKLGGGYGERAEQAVPSTVLTTQEAKDDY